MGIRIARRRSRLEAGLTVARLSPARRVALSLVSERRRRSGRVRDIARNDASLGRLSDSDRALAFRLALGATGATPVLNALIDERLRRPSALEPRVRDALQVAAYEICYLDTPSAVAASQGVELVRSVTPRAVGLANAVLRKLAQEVRPRVATARKLAKEGEAGVFDLSLAAGLPLWLVERIFEERGQLAACQYCLAQLEPAPVYVAANGIRHSADELASLLAVEGISFRPVDGLPGSFELEGSAALTHSGLVKQVDLVVADISAQVVCRITAPEDPCTMLEVGQGRGTKSVLLASALDAVHPQEIVGVDSVATKVGLSSRRMETAGLANVVSCYELDACTLGDEGLPSELDRLFGSVLVDAPCSGTGTLRRHPEIASSLAAEDIDTLTSLQQRMLEAAARRVAAGGKLSYATCSVLREEDEDVVERFLSSEVGKEFRVEPVSEAPACRENPSLRERVEAAQTPEGYLLTIPSLSSGDGHFCATLRRIVR